MWTKQQIASFQRALACKQKNGELLARLQEIAKHSPTFAETVNEMIARLENCCAIAEIALSIEQESE